MTGFGSQESQILRISDPVLLPETAFRLGLAADGGSAIQV